MTMMPLKPTYPHLDCNLVFLESGGTREDLLGDAERRASVPTQERGNEMKKAERAGSVYGPEDGAQNGLLDLEIWSRTEKRGRP